MAAAIYHDYSLTRDDLPRVVEGKRNLLQSAGCLEAINVNITPEEIGGLFEETGFKRGALSQLQMRIEINPSKEK